jgi:ankyrin repeat protein
MLLWVLLIAFPVGPLDNPRDDTGSTPLTAAVREENKGFVETLLAHGADVDKADDAGYTPLTAAAWEGDEEMVETLHGADANGPIGEQTNSSVFLL